MVNISQIVDESLARLGVEPTFDHLRLQWSRWFRCDSSFSVLLAPAKPGIFAIADEIIPQVAELARDSEGPEGQSIVAHRFIAGKWETATPSPVGTAEPARVKRMLALLEIRETDDIGMALGRLFLPGNPLREKLEAGKCFTRYAVIEDSAERAAANNIFQRWMLDSTETNSYQDVA